MKSAMSIELTAQQQQALTDSAGFPPIVFDPRSNETYYLVPKSDYLAMQERLEDERQQRAIRGVGLRNADRRMGDLP